MTDMEQLARRAVACKGWRLMKGMRVRWYSDESTYDGGDEWFTAIEGWANPVSRNNPQGWWLMPDFSDPATLGCLLALVREAWGGSGGTHLTAVGWRYYTPNGHLCSEGATEGEALVAALEAAGGE